MALCLIVEVIALSLFPFSTTLKMFILIAVILGIGRALLYPSLMVHAIERFGRLPGSSHGDFHGPGRFRSRDRPDDHRRSPAMDQLSDYVYFFGSHRDHKSSFFLFHHWEKRWNIR